MGDGQAHCFFNLSISNSSPRPPRSLRLIFLRNRPVSRILWRLSNADGHFSAATIARRMAAKLWSCSSSQPESSPGRVFREFPLGLRFLLGLAPDGGYLSRRVTATLVRSYFKTLRPAPFHPCRRQETEYRRQKRGAWQQFLTSAFCILSPVFCGIVSVALSRRFGSLRAGSPLATVLPCGVRTFLTATCDITARPSSLFLTLSITCC